MILGITPARGGSKGLPRKNVRPLCGKPLLAWTIEAARGAGLLDEYVVSTEDGEIARVASECGVPVLPRPPELAGDEITTLAVLQHVLALRPTAMVLVLLQATSPIRDPGLIDACVRRFLDTGADSLATGFVCRCRGYGTGNRRRQDVPGCFCDDGNVYVMKTALVRSGDRFGRAREQVVLDREQNVDIDDEFDFWLAEQVLRRRRQRSRAGGEDFWPN
jgi:N-acylneuraminate cytidylyltransferase